MGKRFSIDFFEFSFLVEACIPPRPIARSMFWREVIDVYYHQMSDDERKRLHDWIGRNPAFNLAEPDCYMFHCRFDPENQYLVKAVNDGRVHEFECFRMGERYHTSSNTSIVDEAIVSVRAKRAL